MIGFKCVGGGDFVRITHVELDDTRDSDQFMPYTGPVFDELDETLQQAFVDYLDERGGRLVAQSSSRRGCVGLGASDVGGRARGGVRFRGLGDCKRACVWRGGCY